MRCVITGIAGFIGSHLAERLLAGGHEVLGIDALTSYYDPAIKRRNLAEIGAHPRLRVIVDDLATMDLAPVLDGQEWIFHLAGQPGVRASWGDGFGEYTRLNITATQRLLKALAARPPVKLIAASSSSVYGKAPLPLRETTLPEPLSPYGITKLAAEHLALAYHEAFGFPVASLRFFTVYGPRQRPDMAFSRFIHAIATGQPVTLYGDGTQTRDFTYVDDVARACLAAAEQPAGQGIFNIGGGSRVALGETLEYLGEILGRVPVLERQPVQRGDAAHTQADVARAQAALGWQSAVSWREGLRRQVAWFRCHT